MMYPLLVYCVAGMTNTNLRNFLRQVSDEFLSSLDRFDLLNYFRRFITNHSTLCTSASSPEVDVSSLPVCMNTNCVCCAICPLDQRRYEEMELKSQSVAVGQDEVPCVVTKALQIFLNHIKHPHDIPGALVELNAAK